MRATLRGWTGALEMFVLEVILEKRRGKGAAFVRFVLLCMSKIFLVLVKLRRVLLRRSGRLL